MSILASVIQLAVTCSCQSPGGAFVSLDLVAVEQLYEFTSNWYRDGRSERTTCQGRRSFVQGFIPLREFADLFGGHVLSEDSSEQQFLGVWGRRKCQLFRRILRERGAQFDLRREMPKLRLRILAVERPRV